MQCTGFINIESMNEEDTLVQNNKTERFQILNQFKLVAM